MQYLKIVDIIDKFIMDNPESNSYEVKAQISGKHNIVDDYFKLNAGQWIIGSQNFKIEVDQLKKTYGDNIPVYIKYIGKIYFRAGVIGQDQGMHWCGDRTFNSDKVNEEIFYLNLDNYKSGHLEIFLYAIENSNLYIDCNFPKNELPKIKDILYPLFFPKQNLCTEESIYYKLKGENCYYSFENSTLNFSKGSVIDLMSYFNSFSAEKWFKYTNIENLSLNLIISGTGIIEVLHRNLVSSKIISTWKFSNNEKDSIILSIDDIPRDGLIGVQIYALDDCVLYGGNWLSNTEPVQDIKLGIGITTFKRELEVEKSIDRLSKQIASNDKYKNSIDIVVVDNGQTLKDDDVIGAKLIPNKNYGGTGGFTRSLLEFQKNTSYTHCLFMDDDASCEVESIFLCISFLSHAKDDKTSICGAMLYQNIQFLQWENGAWFDKGCHSLKRDYDLRHIYQVLRNEIEDKTNSHKIYGAWWFFIFPIKYVKNYSIPFFVRGDDIDFSYMNTFKVITLNGASCWQEDFKTKENANSVYFFIRSHIVHHLTIPNLNSSFFSIFKIIRKHFFTFNNSYLYGTAACINLALSHILQGPDFFSKNLLPDQIFKEIKSLSYSESPKKISQKDVELMIFADRNLKTAIFPKLLRTLSFNGHLYPRFLLSHTPNAMLFKRMLPLPNRFYLRDCMTIVDIFNLNKIELKRNSILYFKNLFNFTILIFKFFIKFKYIKNQYTKSSIKFREKNFWQKLFS